MMKRLLRLVFTLLMLSGAALICMPVLLDTGYEVRNRTQMQAMSEEEKTDGEKRRFYEIMHAYNRRLWIEQQKDLLTLESLQQTPDELLMIRDQILGYVQIESIDVTLPLLLGATDEHMDQGAVILGNTSMPTGEKNSNCVIAAHRGWRCCRYFRDIEEIAVGDQIRISCLGQEYIYRVTCSQIIEPDDLDAIRIQEGKDMVTLLTCHPYLGQGRYRYLVLAEREEMADDTVGHADGSVDEDIRSNQPVSRTLSYYRITLERFLRLLSGLVMLIWILNIYIEKRKRNET